MLRGKSIRQPYLNKRFQTTILLVTLTVLILIASIKAQQEGTQLKEHNTGLFQTTKNNLHE